MSVSANYAGDVSPREAWKILSSDEKAVLIDVRTAPEWSFVGVPDLGPAGKQLVPPTRATYPPMEIDGGFPAPLSPTGADRDAPLLFLCRSGARSRSAAMAMTQAGYRRCYNIATG